MIAGNKIDDVEPIDVSFIDTFTAYSNGFCSTIVEFQQLELIALQFVHQKPQFSACGFFPIDMTFIYAVRMCWLPIFDQASELNSIYLWFIGLWRSYYVLGDIVTIQLWLKIESRNTSKHSHKLSTISTFDLIQYEMKIAYFHMCVFDCSNLGKT